MNRSIVVTSSDRSRLVNLVEETAARNAAARRYLDDLSNELSRAKIVEPRDIPTNVITMNSTVLLRDLDTDEEFDYTLVYPHEADPLESRISVLAPVGTALLGYREGDVVEWPVPAGKARLLVESVLFQPERAGAGEM
jgi:regulator of nucleoside diphosphate kinase